MSPQGFQLSRTVVGVLFKLFFGLGKFLLVLVEVPGLLFEPTFQLSQLRLQLLNFLIEFARLRRTIIKHLVLLLFKGLLQNLHVLVQL